VDALDDPLMFLPEVARATGLSPTTIWRKERNGEFPSRHHDGRYVSWFRSQIAAYMEARRRAPSGIGPAPIKANEARRHKAQAAGAVATPEPLRTSRRVSRDRKAGAKRARSTDTEITDR
jgi:predicted DNA-binding transcriptional regulator AlpA